MVASAVPLKSTTEEAIKLVPFTVRVKLLPPAVVDVGDMEVVVGTGFLTVNV